MHVSQGLRTIALVEATKGAVVLLVGIGLFSLTHHDIEALAEALVRHAHLNPASHRPNVFIELANKVNDAGLWQLAVAACAYSSVRFIEAYGLWRQSTWGQWFAAVSGGVYVPFEVKELFERPGWLSLGLLLLNLGIVAFMLYSLRHKKASVRASSMG